MATENIILDGQKLSGEDHYGEWITSSLDGWWSSPEPKGENVARENADGDFDLPTFYEARYITITGSLRAKNHEAQHQAINRFTALVRRRARLQVLGHGAAQWADVVRASGFKMEPITDTYAQWQLRLKSPDPRKFGDMNTFTLNSGTANGVFHRGNYWATPKYTIRGSMPGGYTLHLAGTYYTVGRALVSTAPHTIDFRNGRLYVGGVLTSGGIAAAANLTLVGPGGVPTAGIEPTTTGTAVATMELLDTYI